MTLRSILRVISKPAQYSHSNHGTAGYRTIVMRSAFGGAIGLAAEELAVR